jgi:hypothetical protein
MAHRMGINGPSEALECDAAQQNRQSQRLSRGSAAPLGKLAPYFACAPKTVRQARVPIVAMFPRCGHPASFRAGKGTTLVVFIHYYSLSPFLAGERLQTAAPLFPMQPSFCLANGCALFHFKTGQLQGGGNVSRRPRVQARASHG